MIIVRSLFFVGVLEDVVEEIGEGEKGGDPGESGSIREGNIGIGCHKLLTHPHQKKLPRRFKTK